jgi:hypothetical protein
MIDFQLFMRIFRCLGVPPPSRYALWRGRVLRGCRCFAPAAQSAAAPTPAHACAREAGSHQVAPIVSQIKLLYFL